jgi:two-component system cell cycle sensor histidine kinase/response regulator CckA
MDVNMKSMPQAVGNHNLFAGEIAALEASSPEKIRASRCIKLSRIAISAIFAISLFCLLTWILDLPRLRSLSTRFAPMTVNTAFALICTSIALYIVQHKCSGGIAKTIVLCIGGVIFILAVLTLLEYTSGFDLYIDRLFSQKPFSEEFPYASGRMSPISALNFLLIGTMFIILSSRSKSNIYLIQFITLIIGNISLLTLIGYFYSITILYQISSLKPISVRTSFCFICVFIGSLFAQPDQGVMRNILSEDYGGIIIRRFILFVIIIPVLLGGIVLAGSELSFYGNSVAMLILVVLTIVAFTILLLINGRTISKTDSERLKAEGDYRSSEKRFKELFEHIGNGVAVYETSNDGKIFKIVDFNRSAEKIDNVRRESIVGSDALEVFPGIESMGLLEVFRRVWKTGKAEIFTGCIGQEREDVSWRNNHVYKLPSGQVVCIYDDITDKIKSEQEKKALELQLLQAQKMEAIGRLAGGVAHDFNNLLTAIMGYCDLILESDPEELELHNDIMQIKTAANNASSLTNQLLAFSRNQVLIPKVININSVIKSTEQMLRRLIGEDIELKCLLSEDVESIKADPAQLVQVILNLVVNARDAMPKGGKIILESKSVFIDEQNTHKHLEMKSGSYTVLSISDTGEGMDKSTLEYVFEPFYTTKELGKGTGLGLSTVYGIVKQSRGNIYAYSEQGIGTTFRIYFPSILEAAEAHAPGCQPEKATGGSETILFVEDEDIVRGFTIEILKRNGYNVLNARNGKEATEIAGRLKRDIDLLLTDVIMPRMSGKELAHKLAVCFPEMKVLFISGYPKDYISHHGILDDEINFLQKPFNAQDLLKKIRSVLSSQEVSKLPV